MYSPEGAPQTTLVQFFLEILEFVGCDLVASSVIVSQAKVALYLYLLTYLLTYSRKENNVPTWLLMCSQVGLV